MHPAALYTDLHLLIVVPGSSGAPFYKYDASLGERTVYGIQAYHICPSGSVTGTHQQECTSSSGINRAMRINGPRYNQLCSVIDDVTVC